MHTLTTFFSQIPALGCIRDRKGRILAVTNRLGEAAGMAPATLIGKLVTDVWPHGKPWLALDRAALRARKPLTRLEYGNGQWLRSVRIPESANRVAWVAEDVSDSVRLSALRGLLTATLTGDATRHAIGDPEQMLAGLVHDGKLSMRSAATALSFSVEEFGGSCIRLLRS
jgi:PAS domain-containing protein